MDSRLYWIWLAQALGAGSPSTGPLLEQFDTAAAIYAATPEQLREAGASPALIRRLASHDLAEAHEILNRLLSFGGWLLTPEDALYPPGFHLMKDRPVALYCRGVLPSLKDCPAIALVGTRHATPSGVREAYALSADLAAGGMIVVSGGAKGIDKAAHEGAVAAGGRTIVVMACPPDEEYPMETQAVRQQILATGQGALVSEYPPGIVSKCNFQIRNRLMVGMSLGVCLAETPTRSGARISARLARELGRDVYALPGAISGHHNDGAHREIRGGAALVTASTDIIEEYSPLYPGLLDMEASRDTQRRMEKEQLAFSAADTPQSPSAGQTKKQQSPSPSDEKEVVASPASSAKPEGASATALQVYEALHDTPQPVDTLAEITGLPVPALLAALTELEMLGCAANCAAQQYRRI